MQLIRIYPSVQALLLLLVHHQSIRPRFVGANYNSSTEINRVASIGDSSKNSPAASVAAAAGASAAAASASTSS